VINLTDLQRWHFADMAASSAISALAHPSADKFVDRI
jgi:hypothetical protein